MFSRDEFAIRRLSNCPILSLLVKPYVKLNDFRLDCSIVMEFTDSTAKVIPFGSVAFL